ncbi:MAG: class I SAM-dependent methyltransferase [Candidatus Nealsonbacteria bacterium]|nr:class I SAM-dependent methyltransferase [Candidatus Nealsonbacteria bacterium]
MKTVISKNLCPLCGSARTSNFFNLDCGNWDRSTLYPSVKIAVCRKCGHIFNQLTSAEITGLTQYYDKEYALTNLDSGDETSDRPGSCNMLTKKRYDQLFHFISPYLKKRFRILDVGCAGGGFLRYLRQKGWLRLYGVDPTKKYVNYAQKKNSGQVKLGSAEAVSFKDGSMDMLILDQVMEHLIDPRQALREAKRVLTANGLLCISVPDASRYGRRYFFDFFWFLVREHIQHFDLEHLKLAAALEGFELLTESKSELPMTSEKMILPVLSAVFRLAVISRLAVLRRPVYAWGIGREFLYLYESAGLKKCHLAGLIDLNSYKQKKISIDGRPMGEPMVLKQASPDSVLIISAVAHTKPIKKEARKLGYRGQILAI